MLEWNVGKNHFIISISMVAGNIKYTMEVKSFN